MGHGPPSISLLDGQAGHFWVCLVYLVPSSCCLSDHGSAILRQAMHVENVRPSTLNNLDLDVA
jgi:hypothetical protein